MSKKAKRINAAIKAYNLLRAPLGTNTDETELTYTREDIDEAAEAILEVLKTDNIVAAEASSKICN